jgi:hypothetical protein
MMKNPIWISVADGNVFNGTQWHWSHAFFTNAYREEIEKALMGGVVLGALYSYLIREMTDEEVQRYPEAVAFRDHLIAIYGKA